MSFFDAIIRWLIMDVGAFAYENIALFWWVSAIFVVFLLMVRATMPHDLWPQKQYAARRHAEYLLMALGILSGSLLYLEHFYAVATRSAQPEIVAALAQFVQ